MKPTAEIIMLPIAGRKKNSPAAIGLAGLFWLGDRAVIAALVVAALKLLS